MKLSVQNVGHRKRYDDDVTDTKFFILRHSRNKFLRYRRSKKRAEVFFGCFATSNWTEEARFDRFGIVWEKKWKENRTTLQMRERASLDATASDHNENDDKWKENEQCGQMLVIKSSPIFPKVAQNVATTALFIYWHVLKLPVSHQIV